MGELRAFFGDTLSYKPGERLQVSQEFISRMSSAKRATQAPKSTVQTAELRCTKVPVKPEAGDEAAGGLTAH